MMRNYGKRGLPIGLYTSQPLGNYIVSDLDHYTNEQIKAKHYLRYCDDCVMLVSSKKEAKKVLKAFNAYACDKLGLCVKSNSVIFPVGHEFSREKKRKRMRGKRKEY